MSEVIDASANIKTAVLFLIFNRPDTTKQVFDAIRQAKPPRLYVASDGARVSRDGEAALVSHVRQIATAVDWPCEVKTLYREKNLGCKMAVSSGIDWFFENEEQGIILEDDCLPNNDFFMFCEEMLDRYKNVRDIGMVSGFNPLGPSVISNEYFASRNSSIWGWATWRDRWASYDVDMAEWDNQEIKRKIRKSLSFKNYLYYRRCFDLIKRQSLNTWDYQWTFCLISKNYKTIKPLANLIKNIGTEGTHAIAEDVNHNLEHGQLSSAPLVRNDGIGYVQDQWFFRTRIPSAPKMLVLSLLQVIGLYPYARSFYFSVKSLKNRFV
jgi:hypothetical protein